LIAHGGPRWGIEFKGGTSIQVLFKKPVSTASLRANLEKAGFPRAKIQKIGRGNEFVIYSTRSSSNVKDEIKEALKSSYGSDFEIRKVDMIGPKISKDLKKKGGGAGRGRGQGGRGMGGGRGLGPGGNCVCPKCGYSIPHERGMPCYQMKCPKCGTQMVRR